MMEYWIEVFLNLPLRRSFFYRYNWDANSQSGFTLQIGMRAQVMFGKRKMTAFIVSLSDELPAIDFSVEKIRPIERIIDKEPLFTAEQIRLALWMENYYLCARGEALSIMLPSGRREIETGGFSLAEDALEFAQRTLSYEQKTAAAGILKNSGIHYLYGATGSGKTEVFLQAAEKKLAEDKGVIYLVPEIGLTHQVIEAVVRRFGETAAVLHSGLTGSQKLAQWRRIIEKKARVVIGARSAVFAPVPNLGLIIIDEEHDASYKSGSSPRYSARQVAMRRCADLNIPLVMGSATPSVESWLLMEEGKIRKHVLSRRLSGGSPPLIEVVHLGKESQDSKASGCISRRLEEEMRKTFQAGRQTILFLNRRGFTHFFRCNFCAYQLSCKNCSVALTYHKKDKLLRCHYCGWSIKPPTQCPQCASLDIVYTGFGTEFIEEEVRSKFLGARIQRIDTDSLTYKGELQEKLDSFRRGDIDILMGTQMVAKGLNFPGVQLVGVILADTGLQMPDFRASERTFSLIVQVAGRAGRFFPDGKVIVQTYNPERAAIAFACSGDIDGFYRQELEQRKLLDFPPYMRLLRLVFRSANKLMCENAAAESASILNSILKKQKNLKSLQSQAENTATVLLGPSACALEKIAANYRYQILLRGPRLLLLQGAAASFLVNYKTPSGLYIEVDVDPISLL